MNPAVHIGDGDELACGRFDERDHRPSDRRRRCRSDWRVGLHEVEPGGSDASIAAIFQLKLARCCVAYSKDYLQKTIFKRLFSKDYFQKTIFKRLFSKDSHELKHGRGGVDDILFQRCFVECCSNVFAVDNQRR
jgi:hypothetical protein